jgi:hypothetical protein
MTTSQQLLRKLLKATAPDEGSRIVASAEPNVRSDKKSPKRKRKQESDEPQIRVDDDTLLTWHAQTLLSTDRAMNARGSKNSNKAAFHKSKRRLEQALVQTREANDKAARTAANAAAARTAPATSHTLHEPTFDKKRHQEEKAQRKRHKLAKTLQAMSATQRRKKAPTIFG